MNRKIIAAALICLIAAAGIILYISLAARGAYVAEISGKKISTDEYYMYLYAQKIKYEASGGEDIWEMWYEGESVENIAKQDALDSIIYIKVVVSQASRLGITLSKEEEELASQNADMYMTIIDNRYNVNRNMVVSVMNDMLINDKVYEAVTGSYEPSEADFVSYYEDYLRTSRDEYIDIELQCIFIEGLNEASQKRIGEARSSLYNLVPFETVVKTYSDRYNETEGVVTYTEIPSGWDTAVYNAAYELEEGEISEIISVKEGYYILYAKKITLPDMEELKNSQREYYIDIKKDEIYNQEYIKWSRDVVIKKNDKVWNEIRIMA